MERAMNDDEQVVIRADEKIIEMLEEYSGPIVRDLYRSEATTHESITHSDPTVRFAAITVMHMKWGVSQRIADVCETLAVDDPDAKVRGAAVTCVGTYYRKTDHARIIKMLATIVVDEAEELGVREAAYNALFSLREPDPLKWPLLPGFTFPNDINWKFVNACLESQDK
jgi:hypothetical protein